MVWKTITILYFTNFFVVTGKTKDIYQNAFTNLLIKMKYLNLNWWPKMIYSDFEQVINFALVVFSNALRKGYNFHLGQWAYEKKKN